MKNSQTSFGQITFNFFNDIPRMSLHCKLVPVQYRDANMVYCNIANFIYQQRLTYRTSYTSLDIS